MSFQSTPVGMYHHVNEREGDFITVHVRNFQSQMEMLARNGYTTITPDQLLDFKLRKAELPKKSFLITFDDAWLDVYVHAFPILIRFGFNFTVFVVTDWADSATLDPLDQLPASFPSHGESELLVSGGKSSEVVCNWTHLQEMVSSGLCTLENHTASHRVSTHLSPDDLKGDLERSLLSFRNRLGKDTKHLCWPKGYHNQETESLAKEIGFQSTYLVRRGVNLQGGSAFGIKRFTVDDYPGEWLLKQLQIFSRPIYGYLYSRIKPDRLSKKLRAAFGR